MWFCTFFFFQNNWVSRGPEQDPITIVHKEAKIKEKEEPRKVQPQMDEKIQQGPWAQVTLVKDSGGGAKAGDSGEVTPHDFQT